METGTDGDALLAAVLANPADDTPRLVYADYLQENGREARAALIRWQIEYRVAFHLIDGNWVRRAARIVRRVPGECWHALNAFTSEPFPREFSVTRGFLSHVTCPAEDWVRHADALVATQPVERVTLTTIPLLRGDGVRVGLHGDPAGLTFDDLRPRRPEPLDLVLAALGRRCPGIVFGLPDAGSFGGINRELFERVNREMRAGEMRVPDLPPDVATPTSGG